MKQKTNLNLHRRKSKRRKSYSWIDTFHEINESDPGKQIKQKRLNLSKSYNIITRYSESPKHGLKRCAYKSPHEKTSKVKTPSKSPYEKKARKCLSNIYYTCNKENIMKNVAIDEPCQNDENETRDNLQFEDIIEQNENKYIENEMTELLPMVLSNLSKSGFDETLLMFFRQVSRNTFPLSNISFLLWSEVVKWFNCESSCYMRFSEETKKFWKLGYRLFGGRFVHFMSGFKKVGFNYYNGVCPKISSNINFAVPDIDILRNYSPYSLISHETNSRKPGIFLDIIESLSKSMSGKSCCITFDGKKLKQGLTKTDGDIDLLGFEKDLSLVERKEEHVMRIEPLKNMIQILKEKEEICEVNSLSSTNLSDLKLLLNNTMTNLSKQILTIQEKRIKKDYAKKKLIEKSGETNWKNGKYVYAISSMISYIHDIDIYLGDANILLEELIQSIAFINKVKCVSTNEINLEQTEQYIKISDSANDKTNTRMVKQRSKEWFDARKEARVTGSTIYKAIGLDGLNNQKQYFDNVICTIPEKEMSQNARQATEHGTANEVNATATFVGKVLPLLYPHKTFNKEGYVEYGLFKERPFMIISPDGSVRDTNEEKSTIAAIELKCPLHDIHKEFPARYLLQCLSEIEALDVDHLIYLCWRSDISSVFRVSRNKLLFNRAFNLAQRLYGTENPNRCTKLSEEAKCLKKDIIDECKNVQFMFIVPSLKSTTLTDTNYSTNEFRLSRILLMLEDVIKIYDKYYELNRQPATEAVVFLCCDLNRAWKDNTVRSAPVCWFPKGYSLDTETMLKILETVLCECKSYGLHIPAISYDGQWHNICVRDIAGEPLTLLQLQKDVWKRVEHMSKSEILKEIKSKNKNPTWQFERVQDGRCVITTNSRKSILPSFSPRIFEQRLIENKKKLKESNIDTLNGLSDAKKKSNNQHVNVESLSASRTEEFDERMQLPLSDGKSSEDDVEEGASTEECLDKSKEHLTIEDSNTILTDKSR